VPDVERPIVAVSVSSPTLITVSWSGAVPSGSRFRLHILPVDVSVLPTKSTVKSTPSLSTTVDVPDPPIGFQREYGDEGDSSMTGLQIYTL